MTSFPPTLRSCCQRFLNTAERRPRMRLASLLFLFDLIRDVPGDIVELGVASGESLRMWFHFIAEHDGSKRTLWGFDTFAGFPSFAPEDGVEIPMIGKRIGGETEIRDRPTTKQEVVASLLAMFQSSWRSDVYGKLVEGDITVTLRKHTPPSPLALVFCDADLYTPTKAAIDLLWSRLAPGGLIIFDEYGQEPWPGEKKAVDDFIAVNPGLILERLDMESGPTALVVKP